MNIRVIQEKKVAGRKPYEDKEIRCVIYSYKSTPGKPHYEIKFSFGRKVEVASNYNIGVGENGKLVFFPDKNGFKVTHKNREMITYLSAKLQPATIDALPKDIKEKLGLFSKCRVRVSLDKECNLWVDGIDNWQ